MGKQDEMDRTGWLEMHEELLLWDRMDEDDAWLDLERIALSGLEISHFVILRRYCMVIMTGDILESTRRDET